MPRSAEADAIARAYPGMTALLFAIEHCGGIPSLALRIPTTPGRVNAWLNSSRRVPLEYVPAVVDATDHPSVTPYTLRPDFAAGWRRLARQLPRDDETVEVLEGEPQ
jgi:DNA-binding transcriptional regulator YdaS (Cro superfamily)